MKKVNKILLGLYKDKDQILSLSTLVVWCVWIDSFIPKNPHVIEATGVIVGAVVAVGTLAYKMWSGGKKRKAAKEAAAKAEAEQKRKNALLAKEKAAYKALKFTNPYSDMQNQFKNMENTYEDLTVNQKQADFEQDMAQQQQSNVLNKMSEAAGGSGIAALAQSMANAGTLQAQKASASLGMQESKIQQLKAGEGSRLQEIERKGETNVEMAKRGGAAKVQQMNADRQATILGLEYGASAGAAAATQAASLNQQQVDAETKKATAEAVGTVAEKGIDVYKQYGKKAKTGGEDDENGEGE
jgi:hypothetical protein